MVHKMRLGASNRPFMKVVMPILFILCSVSVILLAYFFYDIMGKSQSALLLWSH